MVVIVLENVSPSLRGELSRWLLEPHPGVFVGHVTALVRDLLWQKCCKGVKEGGALQIWSTNTEQRFQMRAWGLTQRQIVDMEGLQLIRLPATATLEQQALLKRLAALQLAAPAAGGA